MVVKNAATEEILELLSEITARLDKLEESLDQSINTERCQLWGSQYRMINAAQENFDKAEREWMIKEFEDHSFILRSDASKKTLPMNPKLGY
jgi:hypothetical protein